MSTRPSPTTLRDVGARAGVSAMTVSRVLHDDPKVLPETRDRVREAAEELGYRRNTAARNLRLGRSAGLVGLVVTNLGNPFYSRFALGVESVVAEHGLRLVLSSTGGYVDRERQVVDDCAARRVDGLIVVPTSGTQQAHLSPEALGGTQVVFAVRPRTTGGADTVLIDDRGGAREATSELLAGGSRRIAFIGLTPQLWNSAERYEGFLAAHRDAGVALDRSLLRSHPREPEAARLATLDLLDGPAPPTALFCANNGQTVGALRAVKQRGSDVAVAGFDDIELADLMQRPLLVVSYDPFDMGERAAELLLTRLDPGTPPESPPQQLVLPVRLKRYAG